MPLTTNKFFQSMKTTLTETQRVITLTKQLEHQIKQLKHVSKTINDTSVDINHAVNKFKLKNEAHFNKITYHLDQIQDELKKLKH